MMIKAMIVKKKPRTAQRTELRPLLLAIAEHAHAMRIASTNPISEPNVEMPPAASSVAMCTVM